MDAYKDMSTNISKALKVVSMPTMTDSIKLDASVFGANALKGMKVGDRPYRVNSVNISLRRH